MPSFTGTLAQLVITGAEAATIPARLSGSHAQLRIVGGTATLGPVAVTNLAVTTPALNRLSRMVDKADGETDKQFQRRQQIWQSTMQAIESAFAALTTQVADNTALINSIAAANALAQTANSTALAVASRVDLAGSYTDPTETLTASNDGSITIAAHERVYADGTRVSVNAGSVSGFSPGNYVTVYYVDAGREGGAVAYQGTISAIAQSGSTHIAGQATIPQVGEPPVSGGGPTGPGYTPPSGGGETYNPDYIEE